MSDLAKLNFIERTNGSVPIDDIYSGHARAPNPNSVEELERRLDQALEETFPASDPISIIICQNHKFRITVKVSKQCPSRR